MSNHRRKIPIDGNTLNFDIVIYQNHMKLNSVLS